MTNNTKNKSKVIVFSLLGLLACIAILIVVLARLKPQNGMDAAGTETAEEHVPIVYENEEVQLCQYKGNVVTGIDVSVEPTDEEIEGEYSLICAYASEVAGDFYEDTDEWVATHFTNLSTREELRKSVKQSLINERQRNSPYENRQAALDYVLQHSKVDCKEETLSMYEEQFLEMHKADAINAGFDDFDAYLEAAGYDSEEAFTESDFFQNEIQNAIKLDLITAAIADNEGLTVSEEEIEAYLENAHFDGGDSDAYLAAYFSGNRENVRGYLLQVKAINLLYENTIFVNADGKEIAQDEKQ